jgi:hypothetical protein
MDLAEVGRRLKLALKTEGPAIEAHIQRVQASGRSGGIEKVFADAFHRACSGLELTLEEDLDRLGLRQHYVGRKRGRIDCFIESSRTGFEYKAVRLHRKESSPEFYAGQILADYARLRNPKVLRRAYGVVFLYGPEMSLIASAGSLYRRYHNQMHVDCGTAAQLPHGKATYAGRKVRDLEWDRPWLNASPPEWAVAVKSGSIGAVAFSALDEWS